MPHRGEIAPSKQSARVERVGETLPTTHAIRIARGILLKGNGVNEILPELWPMALFAMAAIGAAVRFYPRRGQGHQPLDNP
jgi:ABC-type multidrug transport system permease subunit